MIKAVIFDLDDTLISEKIYIESGYHHISGILSDRYYEDEDKLYQLLIRLFNDSPQNVFNRVFDKLGISYKRNDIMELVEEYRNHLPNVEFFEDVLPCLLELKKNGIKIGIITDGYFNAQRQKLKAVKAIDFFDEIIVTDELGREYWKPHPMAFELMKEKLNVEFNEMIYVGDNPEKDFYINTIFPIDTVRIIRKNSIHEHKKYFNNTKEKYSISSFNSILDIINV